MSVVLVGNVIDGVAIYGPFEEPSEAVEWATENVSDEWVVAPVHPTENYRYGE